VLDDDAVTDAARRLLAAERSREPIRQLSLQYPDMTIEDAYRVQRALVALKLAGGRTIKARKIGLTSRAMQQAVSISEPDYGVILDDMFFDDGGTVPAERFIRPRVEVELAFVLAQPLKGPGVTALDVLDATRWVTPALEILDARVQMSDPQTGHLRTIVDTISDNAADAGIVVGGRAIRVAAKESSKQAAREMFPEMPKDAGQQKAYARLSDETLFDKKWVKVEVQPEDLPGFKGPRVVCAECGEGINFKREVVVEGRTLCRACAGECYYERI